ncbi:hypothetical protein OIU79_027003, partial [Salix purpurea]
MDTERIIRKWMWRYHKKKAPRILLKPVKPPETFMRKKKPLKPPPSTVKSDEDSTMEPQGYENKIKDKEYLPESNKMTE